MTRREEVAQAIAQVSVANMALFFSLLDTILYPGERTPKKVAEFVRANYEALGDARSESGDKVIGFIVSKLENAEGGDHAV
jgi:hypothetical protein